MPVLLELVGEIMSMRRDQRMNRIDGSFLS